MLCYNFSMTDVYLIEDDPFLGGLLSERLEKEKVKFEWFVNAEDGEARLKSTIPNLILLDLILPGLDGFTFLERLRANEDTKDIEVVVLSNLGDKEDLARTSELGVIHHIVKANANLDDIVVGVKELLANQKK